MTALSCLGLGLAFAIAVSLLVFAGVLIGWLIPQPRRGPRKPEKAPEADRPPSD